MSQRANNTIQSVYEDLLEQAPTKKSKASLAIIKAICDEELQSNNKDFSFEECWQTVF